MALVHQKLCQPGQVSTGTGGLSSLPIALHPPKRISDARPLFGQCSVLSSGISPSVTGWPSENVQDQLVELFEFAPFGSIEIERRQRSRDQDSLLGNLDLSEHHPKRSMPRVTFNSIPSFN